MRDVAGIARGWVGTPFRHRSSVRGAGCDCLGLVLGVWRERGGTVPDLPPYAPDWVQGTRPGILLEALRRHLTEVPVAQDAPGSILVFRLRPQGPGVHLGIAGAVSPVATVIHAMERIGVVEVPLSAPWRRRLVARLTFPEGID